MKDLKISKELISAILGYKTEVNAITQISRYEILVNHNAECGCCNESINLDTFIKLCKEWAYIKNYELRSWKGYCACVCLLDGYGINQKDCIANTEIESIIKACEWILNGK